MKVETTKEIANYSKYSHTHTHAERKGEIYRRVDCVVVACLSYHLLATHQNGKWIQLMRKLKARTYFGFSFVEFPSFT